MTVGPICDYPFVSEEVSVSEEVFDIGPSTEVVASPSREVATTVSGELAVSVEEEGLLVHGDAGVVEQYLAELTSLATDAVDVAGIDRKDLAAVAAGGAGAMNAAMQKGYFVRLSQDSVKLLQTKKIVPGTGGYNRMFVHDGGGRIAGQLQWKRVPVGPSQAMAIQMFAVQMALKTAIASVEDAVERVEGKVNQVLALVHADVVGDVVGQHRTLKQAVEHFEDYGTLLSADWDAIAPLGPALEQVIAKLHEHVRKTLQEFDSTQPIQTRAKSLENASGLDDTLRLLVIAQDSMYLWQMLRIERVRTTEPDHLQHAIMVARRVLADHAAQDAELYNRAHAQLHAVREIKPLEVVRWMSAGDLKTNTDRLRDEFDAFANARRGQVLEWAAHEDPELADALAAAGDAALNAGKRTLEVAGRAYDEINGFGIAKRTGEKLKAAVGKKKSTAHDGVDVGSVVGESTVDPIDVLDSVRLAELAYESGDTAQSRTWWEREAERGNSTAMINLGCLADEDGDDVGAWQWWERAADCGDTDAMVRLGYLAERLGEMGDARSWWYRAAELRDPTAMVNLGVLAAESGDQRAARRWWKRAVIGGSIDAMTHLGALADSVGDARGARHWWKQAAEGGDTIAMVSVGVLAAVGGDVADARTWWEKAAARGDSDAMMYLAESDEGPLDDESEDVTAESEAPVGAADTRPVAKRGADPAHRKWLLAGRYASHVAPFNEYVDELVEERGEWLPYVAPTYGGENARLLSLFQDPGPKTRIGVGTGMLSVENPDDTAARYLNLLMQAGIQIDDTLSWNAYPWYIGGSGYRTNGPTDAQLAAATPVLAHIVGLMPKLRVVLLHGRSAWKAWAQLELRYPELVEGVKVIRTYHTSPRVVEGKSPAERARRERKLSNDFARAQIVLTERA